jgi:hypothetical protein
MGKPYYPAWLDNLADDVTGEGGAWDSLLLLSRLMLEKFAGTPLAKHWEGTP